MTGYLCLRNLVKSYDGKINAVDDISIEITRGEFVTFLGPSGSGKTTTLSMIAGFELPSNGAIELGGRDLAGEQALSAQHRHGVPELRAVSPYVGTAECHLSAEDAAVSRRARSGSAPRRCWPWSALRDFAQRYPRELSGGQQQRVALARGLVFNPDVLLLDEPLGALDKNLREQMQVEIKRIHRELGITMIYVTHDQTEAMTMSDRVVVFSNGAAGTGRHAARRLSTGRQPLRRRIHRRQQFLRRARSTRRVPASSSSLASAACASPTADVPLATSTS